MTSKSCIPAHGNFCKPVQASSNSQRKKRSSLGRKNTSTSGPRTGPRMELLFEILLRGRAPRWQCPKLLQIPRNIVQRVAAPSKLLSQVVLQFWGEAGRAVFACLSPRNYVNAHKQKKPRRVYIPACMFRGIIKPMLDKMAVPACEKNKSGSRRTWAVTSFKKLELVLQAPYLSRQWPEEGIHEGHYRYSIYYYLGQHYSLYVTLTTLTTTSRLLLAI